VVQEIHSHDIDRVAFCARDGRIIQAVFERLRGCAGPLPPSFYLMVSRRALVFPMLDQVGEAELDFLTGQFAALRVDEVLARIGLDPTDHAAAIAHAGLAAHQRVASALEMVHCADCYAH
jgi:predicted HAD superfamily hydrolase